MTFFFSYLILNQVTFAQIYSGHKGSINASIGLAFNFNSNARDFLKDSLGLSNPEYLNYGFSGKSFFLNKFNVSISLAVNQFTHLNDKSLYRVNQFVETIGIGWNHDIGNRFGFSSNINLGIYLSSQRYELINGHNDLYMSVKNQYLNTFLSRSKADFILTQDIKLDGKIYQNVSIFLQYSFAYIQVGKHAKINEINLFNRSNYLCLGITYAIKSKRIALGNAPNSAF